MASGLRHALRLLGRSPGFVATAVVTLALGIGANTAVFGLVRAVLLRPLPYHEPDRLVSVARGDSQPTVVNRRRGILTGAWVWQFRTRATTLSDSAVVRHYSPELSSPVDIFHPDGAERLRGGLVTPNFFDVLGVNAAIGRVFDEPDADREPVAVLSDGYWRRRFGADPGVIGRAVDLMLVGQFETAPKRFTIVGVLPRRFRFTYPRETEVWAILPWSAVGPTPALQYEIVARLRPGRSAQEAQAELTSILRQAETAAGRLPQEWVARFAALVTPLPELAQAEARPGVLLLAAVAAFVLLIACINLVLLLVARMVEREREVAIRAALGASRFRLARQLLVEAATLVALGGAAGIAAAFMAQPILRSLVPPGVTRGDELTVDLPVLAFSLALCGVLTVVCGLAPLWHVPTAALHDRLKRAASHATASSRVTLWRRAVIGVQAATVLVLIVGAALLLHSFWRLRHVHPGYDGRDVITMEMRLMRKDQLQPGRAEAFERDMIDRIRALPGVTDASVTTSVPMRGVDFVWVVGPVGENIQPANMRSVDRRYFALMRIPILAGRAFTEQDTADSPPVAILSESCARMFFGDRNPLGQRLELRDTEPEIVGVVADVRHKTIREAAAPAFYLPRAQQPNPVICLVVRTATDRTATAAAVRKVIFNLDPRQPVERISTLDAIVRQTTSEDRFYAVTTGAFAVIALLLAVAGLYGVARRGVTERTRELAIRIALGAQPGRLVRGTVIQELRPVVVGLSLGLAGAYWLSRLLQRFLFEVSALDPWAYVAAPMLLVAVALVACWVPARRVTRVDPLSALRAE